MSRLSENLAAPHVRGEAGVPTALVYSTPPRPCQSARLKSVVSQALCKTHTAVGTSRGVVLLYDGQQVRLQQEAPTTNRTHPQPPNPWGLPPCRTCR